MHRRWLRFIGVGCAAALTHFISLAVLVEVGGCHPVLANALAWLVALCVSYLGHRSFTFRASTSSFSELGRFSMVSWLAFCINVVGYQFVLQWVAPRYLLAWVPVMLAAALLTYLLSRFWVFAPRN